MIIGLVGFIGSGKGTVADLLVSNHGFIKESFANSVKDAVSAVFGWDRILLEGDTTESRVWREKPDQFWSKKLGKEFSPRLALQLMGTEAGRDVFHTDIWVHTVERRCSPNKNYVIADVRFPNEIKAIKDMGGKVIRVKRGLDPVWFDTALKENTTPWDEHTESMKTMYPHDSAVNRQAMGKMDEKIAGKEGIEGVIKKFQAASDCPARGRRTGRCPAPCR